MGYKNIPLQKERIRIFLRKNTKATWKDIRTKLRIHPERIYKNGMAEAFKDAGIKLPRNFKRKTPEENRKIIVDYIKKHPNTSSNEILKNTRVNPSTFFNSITEAFDLAGVNYPRDIRAGHTYPLIKKIEDISSSLKGIKRTITSNRKNFRLKFNRTYFRDIKNKLKIKKQINKRLKSKDEIKNLKDFYAKKRATILLNKKIRIRDKNNKKMKIVELIKKDPLITIPEIEEKAGMRVNDYFKSIKEAYNKAGIKFIEGHEKRTLRKRNLVIEYIKNNNFATQREVNTNCKTHVQEIFNKGIFEAYKLAGVNFPYERLKLYGVGTKEVRKRSKDFEDEISNKLKGYGNVNRLVKTKRGFADVIFERKGKKAVIEIKDYQAKEISIPQINQLLNYLEDCNCNLGFLICHKKPKKDRFLIDNNKIFVIEKTELNRIPEITDGSVV